MSIFKRLANLWYLSGIEVPKEKKSHKGFIKKVFSQHAIIVDMKDPIKDLQL